MRSRILYASGAVVVLLAMWSSSLRLDATPAGDGGRVIRFIEFARNTAGGLAFWNPLRNGGYPLFGDPEHFWLLSLVVDPMSHWGNLGFNAILLAAIMISAVPAWLIGRKLGWSPFWIAIGMVLLTFTESLIWSQESGRIDGILLYFFLLVVFLIMLDERISYLQYVILVCAIAFCFVGVVYYAAIPCVLVYAGLLSRKVDDRTKTAHVVRATFTTVALIAGGLLLSALCTLPLLGDFARSEIGLARVSYQPNLPVSLASYLRVFIPFAPADPELVTLLPSALMLPYGLAWLPRFEPNDLERRSLRMGLPIFFWAATFIAMSFPVLGPWVQAVYSRVPVVSNIRWFAPIEEAGAIFITIATVSLVRACASQPLASLGRKRRLILGLYMLIALVSVIAHGRMVPDPIVAIVAVPIALFCGYLLLNTVARFSLVGIERLPSWLFSTSLLVISLVVLLLAQHEWYGSQPYTNNSPALPSLENIVQHDADPYFRFIREDNSGLWSLDSYKRDFRAFSLYFPKSFAYSLSYLSPHQATSAQRPHWVQLVGCDDFDLRAVDLLGIKYAFCRRPQAGDSVLPGWMRIGDENGQTLYRRRNFEGGIRLFHDWRTAPVQPPGLVRERVLEAATHGVALVDDGSRILDPPAKVAESKAHDAIALVVDRPGHMLLHVSSAQRGILFIPDNYDAGWHVRINQKQAMVVPVFFAYIGVALEPGNNLVELDYRDQFFEAGQVISGLTAVALIVICPIFLLLRNRLRNRH